MEQIKWIPDESIKLTDGANQYKTLPNRMAVFVMRLTQFILTAWLHPVFSTRSGSKAADSGHSVMRKKTMRLIIFTMIAMIAVAAETAFAQASEPVRPRSLAYMLQTEGISTSRHEAVCRLAECGRDWIVIDTSFDGNDTGKWTVAEITTIQAGRSGCKVLAYLSIGEAENYRGYWKGEWDADHNGRPDAKAPTWLCDENPDWKGNYKVCYWDIAWQDIILKNLDETLNSGFDGVYLDIVDAFEFFEYDPRKRDWIDNRQNPNTGRTYREDMISWVCRIATHARQQRPSFLVVPQNGIQLLEHSSYLTTIDAIGVEDLFTDGNRLQKCEHTTYSLGFLNKVRLTRKPVFVIEYGTKPSIVWHSVKGAEQNDFVLLVTDRELRTLGQSWSNYVDSMSTEPTGARDGVPAAHAPVTLILIADVVPGDPPSLID